MAPCLPDRSPIACPLLGFFVEGGNLRADVLPRFISQSGGFSAGGEPLRLSMS